jgi:hypothetical protein
MKNKLLLSVIMLVTLTMIVGCAPGTSVQITTPKPVTQSGTPVPGNEIDVPGFKIRFNAPGQNPLVNQVDVNNRVSGILIGIWHGIISPVTLILSFINPDIQMYEVHNNGSQYNLGFLIGVALVFLLLGIFAGRRRHHKR